MADTSAFALYAASLAILEEEETAVERLVELAQGDSSRLRDAHDLLDGISVHPDRIERAHLLIERAITRTEQSRRTMRESTHLKSEARQIRQRSGQLRHERAGLRGHDAGNGTDDQRAPRR